jgi:predicted transposase YbfD/YdcC
VEGNIPYLTNSHKTADWLSKNQKGWIKIECAENDEIRTREDTHEEIYEKVKKILK